MSSGLSYKTVNTEKLVYKDYNVTVYTEQMYVKDKEKQTIFYDGHAYKFPDEDGNVDYESRIDRFTLNHRNRFKDKEEFILAIKAEVNKRQMEVVKNV